MRYSADFETTTDVNDCRVWAWGLSTVEEFPEFQYGNDLSDFMDLLETLENPILYFHNLKFDGEFILCWLFENGFERVHKANRSRTFETLISDKGQFYSIKICFLRQGAKINKCVTLLDSLKLLPLPVDKIAKGFGLPIRKLHIDYDSPRPKGHELTRDEIEYLRNDCDIVAIALHMFFVLVLGEKFHPRDVKMTIGSFALSEYKKTLGKEAFLRYFPPPEYDPDIRKSYRGGWVYVSENCKGKNVKSGLVFDVNSLYPSVMYEKPLPYGEGVFFEGQYQENKSFPLYTQLLTCAFKLKKGKLPMIQVHGSSYFMDTEYVKESNVEIALNLTSVDLALFVECYDVYNIEYISGYMFRQSNTMFRDYIDKWISIKNQATLTGNKAMRTIAKLFLNSLYGKFASSPVVQSKFPELLDDGSIHYMLGAKENRKPVYLPVGTFITAWARDKTIRAALAMGDRFLYADTDSLHIRGYEIPKELDVDHVRLGAWKHEGIFDKAKYLRAKAYMEHIKEPDSNDPFEWKVTCAGMPEKVHESVDFNSFEYGKKYDAGTGKLGVKHVKGGIVLVPVDFTLRR